MQLPKQGANKSPQGLAASFGPVAALVNTVINNRVP